MEKASEDNYLGSGGAIKVRSLGSLLGGGLTCATAGVATAAVAVGGGGSRRDSYSGVGDVVVVIGRR